MHSRLFFSSFLWLAATIIFQLVVVGSFQKNQVSYGYPPPLVRKKTIEAEKNHVHDTGRHRIFKNQQISRQVPLLGRQYNLKFSG